jgi:hypothetical protein
LTPCLRENRLSQIAPMATSAMTIPRMALDKSSVR